MAHMSPLYWLSLRSKQKRYDDQGIAHTLTVVVSSAKTTVEGRRHAGNHDRSLKVAVVTRDNW